MVLPKTLLTLACGALLAALALPRPVVAEGNAGAYLAARQAGFESDYAAAAEYFSRALARDPDNPALMENAVTAEIGLGTLDRGLAVARRLAETEANSQVANLALHAAAARSGEWGEIIAGLDAGRGVVPLYDGLMRAWALVGLGKMGEALEAFDAVTEARGSQAFGLYHKALALAAVGDFEGAQAIFAGDAGPAPQLTRRGVIAEAQILGQLDRGPEAADRIDALFGQGADPYLSGLRDALAAGEPVPYTAVTSALDGAAEVHFSIAGALSGEASDGYTLLFARVAEYLRPDHIDNLLLTASILERLGRFELATAVYDRVPTEHALFHAAELGRADALRRAEKVETSIEVLTRLGRTHGELPVVHITLGDTFRRLDRHEEAIAPYTRAIELIGEPEPSHWSLYFSRGIVHERTGRWPEAEADFRMALELEPDQPQVLNYLGYSYVEMQTNLEEALDMIERAVAGQPDSGYITDSLGWVLYRLGRYEEAVGHMERAVELLPVDPVVNDHLGDVYWAVGRKREAEFQWHRALSFISDDEPTDADPERIRRKLEVGLDVVLEEEGAPPLRVANDGG